MSEALKTRFLASTGLQKIAFLAWLSHDLTCHGRCFALDLKGKEQIAAFEGLNELQHTISQDIFHLAQGTSWPGEVVWKNLLGAAASHGLSNHLERSLESVCRIHKSEIHRES